MFTSGFSLPARSFDGSDGTDSYMQPDVNNIKKKKRTRTEKSNKNGEKLGPLKKEIEE
jgi:hypothetical protein